MRSHEKGTVTCAHIRWRHGSRGAATWQVAAGVGCFPVGTEGHCLARMVIVSFGRVSHGGVALRDCWTAKGQNAKVGCWTGREMGWVVFAVVEGLNVATSEKLSGENMKNIFCVFRYKVVHYQKMQKPSYLMIINIIQLNKMSGFNITSMWFKI